MPNEGVVVVVPVVFGGSTVALPNEKAGAVAGVAEVAVVLVVKLEIPVIGLDPNNGVATKLIGAIDELGGEATEVVVAVLDVVVGLFPPKVTCENGRDGANLGGETEAAGDTTTVEMAGFGTVNEITGEALVAGISGAIDTKASGLFGEKAKPPFR